MCFEHLAGQLWSGAAGTRSWNKESWAPFLIHRPSVLHLLLELSSSCPSTTTVRIYAHIYVHTKYTRNIHGEMITESVFLMLFYCRTSLKTRQSFSQTHSFSFRWTVYIVNSEVRIRHCSVIYFTARSLEIVIFQLGMCVRIMSCTFAHLHVFQSVPSVQIIVIWKCAYSRKIVLNGFFSMTTAKFGRMNRTLLFPGIVPTCPLD